MIKKQKRIEVLKQSPFHIEKILLLVGILVISCKQTVQQAQFQTLQLGQGAWLLNGLMKTYWSTPYLPAGSQPS